MKLVNGCGSVTESGILTDRCVVGPCDYIGPIRDDPPMIVLSPNPTLGDFEIGISAKLNLSEIARIEVFNSSTSEIKWSIHNVGNRRLSVQAAGWPPGMYRVRVVLTNEVQIMNVQIKL